MAFDEKLAARVRSRLVDRSDVVEQKMFGGLAFLLRGNMCVGVSGRDLIVRLDPAQTKDALARRHTRQFNLTGRPLRGWILVEPKGTRTDAALAEWLLTGIQYAESLPRK